MLSSLESGGSKDPVFIYRGEKLKAVGVTWFWAKVRKDAGLGDVRLHDLRHNFASHAVMNGEPLAAVSKMLGHGSVAATARYAHLDDARLVSAAEAIGGVMARQLRLPNHAAHLTKDRCT